MLTPANDPARVPEAGVCASTRLSEAQTHSARDPRLPDPGVPGEPPEDHPDLLPPRPLRHHLALSLYWLSNSLMWGVLLHMGLQSRLGDWFGEGQVGYRMGLIGFAGGVIGMVAQIVAGALSDRSLHPWGRRRPFLAAGAMGAAGTLLLLGSAKSFGPFLGAIVLLQLSSGIALAPFTALLPDTVNPREHGKASGLMGAARLLGDSGGLILAGLMLSTKGLGTNDPAVVVPFHDRQMLLLCALMAGFTVLMMLFTCLTIRERPLATRPPGTLWEAAAGAFRLDLRACSDFAWLSLSRAITNFGFYIFLEVLFFFVKFSLQHPDPERATMFVMLPAVVAAALTSAPAGWLSDRIGRKSIILISQFILAGSASLFLVAPNLTVALIAGIPAGIAFGAFASVEWALACNLLPKGESARALGFWNVSVVLPQLLAFPFAGAVGSALSGYPRGLGWRVDFGIAVVCCLAGAYFLRHVREPRKGT